MTEVKDLTEWITARKNKPVSEYNSIELKRACLEIIKNFYIGINVLKVEAQILAHQRDELIKAFKGDCKDLTIQEATLAFEKGIAGLSGPFFGGCFKTYCQFLNWFRKQPEREMAWKQILAKNKEGHIAEKPLTIQETTYRQNQTAIFYFKEYKAGNMPQAGQPIVYEYLVSKGLINWTQQEKDAIQKPAIEKYRSEIEWSMKNQIIGSKQREQVLNNLNTNPTLLMRVKKIGLAKYFDKLIKEGIELESIIE